VTFSSRLFGVQTPDQAFFMQKRVVRRNKIAALQYNAWHPVPANAAYPPTYTRA
jgi:hypothetical protein